MHICPFHSPRFDGDKFSGRASMNNAPFRSFRRRHSDDPLISGAIDDNHNEFEQISCEPLAAASSSSLAPNYKKPARTRKKGQVKLRFHHQALPPEYLQHYEASQNQAECKDIAIESPTKDRNLFLSDCIEAEQRVTDPVQMWLHKINELQEDKIEAKALGERAIADERSAARSAAQSAKSSTQTGSKVMTFNDLPYMGEMTLENSKPRRGRKPKKADICHLIYKNYGTVFPNRPTDGRPGDASSAACRRDGEAGAPPARGKATGSLLEKHLTQDPGEPSAACGSSSRKAKAQPEQPLNLCVRDKYGGNVLIGGSGCCVDNDALMEHASLAAGADFSSGALFSPTLKMQLPNFQTAIFNNLGPSNESAPDACDAASTQSWTPANVLAHPIAMYLQKMSDSANAAPAAPGEQKPHALGSERPQRSVIVARKTSQLLKEEAAAPAADRAGSGEGGSTRPKRKRSAIFIPPVPEESSTNHATEVSICKFKFTGGAKPSLQEKKMLSVDAGGNFRYYSGTGDKSIRGYEFFPRETLQQSSLSACSSAGAFLNASGKKISGDLPPSSLYLNSDLMQMQSDGTKVQRERSAAINGHPSPSRRKRKSKRSMQRESLEKTFKEKGFLIQTQQLESAEGATYCKFRQLRKFTRYLFRSWKDYLPGELQSQSSPLNASARSLTANARNEPSTSDYSPPTAAAATPAGPSHGAQ